MIGKTNDLIRMIHSFKYFSSQAASTHLFEPLNLIDYCLRQVVNAEPLSESTTARLEDRGNTFTPLPLEATETAKPFIEVWDVPFEVATLLNTKFSVAS